MLKRQPEEEGGDRRSVPERLRRYLYYTRRDEDEGRGFPVYVRRPVGGTLDDEQVVGVAAVVCRFREVTLGAQAAEGGRREPLNAELELPLRTATYKDGFCAFRCRWSFRRFHRKTCSILIIGVCWVSNIQQSTYVRDKIRG